ncbi:MAG: hypothetical protein LH478_11780 [Chitinophagaceae bacterium]|nr:hypothetical protein [Chitinophagaceae bacterium]
MKKELRKELHQIIDEIEDEQVLYILKEDLANYATTNMAKGLSAMQLTQLDKAIEQADSSIDLQDWESFKRNIQDKWKEE